MQMKLGYTGRECGRNPLSLKKKWQRLDSKQANPEQQPCLSTYGKGVIEAFKRYYALLRSVLIGQEKDETILEIYKGINLKNAVYMAAEAWTNVKATTLKKSWNKLCPAVESEASLTSEEPTNENFVSEMVELMKEVPGFEECDQENVHEWLKFDEDDPGYELLTEDDIVAQVEVPEDDDDYDKISDDIVSAEKCPSNEEAFKCFETVIKWLEHQDECDSVQLLSLKRLRDLAAKRRVSKLKQTNMFDFFLD
ncbi:jerky protein homolog-like [Anastrepha obliqua]|uniref:jerky protein homolog-like n=1 Tax=Anastrepha obliqua TaxID=95512 RepID=UPI002409EF7C|nr:jerky protein homolog-like [Anastrepha obliqua]